MRLTPLDIRHKEFKRGMRGYLDAEVDEFLDAVADEFERLFKENIELNERIEAQERALSGREEGQQQEVAQLQQQVARYHEMEATLQNALLTAQQSADDLRAQAHRDADGLMQQTEVRAREVLADAYADRERVEKDTVALHNQEAEFRFKFRAMLEGFLKQLGALDETSQDPTTEYERQTQALRDSITGAGVPRVQEEPAVPPKPEQTAPERRPPEPQPDPVVRSEPEARPPAPLPQPSPEPRGQEAPSPAPSVPPQREPAPDEPARPERDDEDDTNALTMKPETESQERSAAPEDEDTALTIAPLPDDDAFFGEEDGGNTEFKW